MLMIMSYLTIANDLSQSVKQYFLTSEFNLNIQPSNHIILDLYTCLYHLSSYK